MDPKNRIDSHMLAKKLAGIYKKSQRSKSYCLTGRPVTESASLSSEWMVPEPLQYGQETKLKMKQSGRPLDHFDPKARRLVRSQDSYPPSLRPLSPDPISKLDPTSGFGAIALVKPSTLGEARRPASRDDTQGLHLQGDEPRMTRGQTLSGHTQPMQEDLADVVTGSLSKIPELSPETSETRTPAKEALEVSSTLRPEGSELGADPNSDTISTSQNDQVLSQTGSQNRTLQEPTPAETMVGRHVNPEVERLVTEETPLLGRHDPDRGSPSRGRTEDRNMQDGQGMLSRAVMTTAVVSTPMGGEPQMNMENGGFHNQNRERDKKKTSRWAGCLRDCFFGPREDSVG